MKRIYILAALVLLSACATLTGSEDYIPIGPQNLSVQITDYKKMPVFITRSEIRRPWASLGLYRIKNLPNNRQVILREVDGIKKFAAAKGAHGVIINQYFEEQSDIAYPVTLAAYLVRYMDNVSAEDKAKMDEFSKIAAMETIKE